MSADLLKSWRDKAAKGDMDISFQSVLTNFDDLTAWKQNAEQEDKKRIRSGALSGKADISTIRISLSAYFLISMRASR